MPLEYVYVQSALATVGGNMGIEAIVGALESVQDPAKSNLIAIQQSIEAAHEAKLANNFEISVSKASELSAMDLQAPLGATEVRAYNTTGATELNLYPEDKGSTIGTNTLTYLESFSNRAKQFDLKGMGDIASIDKAPDQKASATTDVKDDGVIRDLGTNQAIQYMKDTFRFAIESEFISAVSTRTSKTFNDLMKGQ